MSLRNKTSRREYWFFYRYDTLLSEGFSPEEASLVSLVKISSPQIRRLRRIKKGVLAGYIRAGLSKKEAIAATRNHFIDSDKEILTWKDFRDFLYPKNMMIRSW